MTLMTDKAPDNGIRKPEGPAFKFLRVYLADGPRLTSDLFPAAKHQGLGKRRLQRALRALGGTSRRVSTTACEWRLPEGAALCRKVKRRWRENPSLWYSRATGLPVELSGRRLGFGTIAPCRCLKPPGDSCGMLTPWKLGSFPVCPRCQRRLNAGWTGYKLPEPRRADPGSELPS